MCLIITLRTLRNCSELMKGIVFKGELLEPVAPFCSCGFNIWRTCWGHQGLVLFLGTRPCQAMREVLKPPRSLVQSDSDHLSITCVSLLSGTSCSSLTHWGQLAFTLFSMKNTCAETVTNPLILIFLLLKSCWFFINNFYLIVLCRVNTH